jgi:YegS/Rv2252/BmrU family lipid kinase
MKLVFIVNNKDNRLAKTLPGLRNYCQDTINGHVEFLFTDRSKHAVELAREASTNGCDYLIAVGGDGTLNEVVNGIMQSELRESDSPILGLLPYGSANDFARTAGISNSIEDLNTLIQTESTQKIDLGKISINQTGETRYFINIAGVGLGAEVAKNLTGSSSLLGPGFNYFKHIINGFLRYVKKEVSCTSSSWEWKGKLLQMAVAKGRYFGNAICVAPDAKLSNGQFQLAIFGDLSLWDYVKNLSKLKKGVKIDLPEVSYHYAREVLLESDDICGIEADGEYVGLLPVSIKVLPKAISFLMPPQITLKNTEID